MRQILLFIILLHAFFTNAQNYKRTFPPSSTPKYLVINGRDGYIDKDYFNSNIVYITYGTKRSLIKQGMLVKKGFLLLRIFLRPRFNHKYKPDPSIYEKNMKYDLTVKRCATFKIFYETDIYPPRDRNSYHIGSDGFLYIVNPDIFWETSNVAIIRVH